MKKLLWASLAAVALLGISSSPVSADHCCQPACPAPATCMVERTVLVPHMMMETRKVCVTECRAETHTRRITVCRMVEERKEVAYEYCVMRPETRTRQETYQEKL